MIRWAFMIVASGALVAGCASSSAPSSDTAGAAPPVKDRNGCATAQGALGTYSETMNAMQDKTATVADSAAGFGKVSKKLGDVASIAGPELAPHARAASVAAGRLRVALSEADATVDVSTEAATLRTEARAINAFCES